MSKEDFYSLTPDQVLAAVDQCGFRTTGQFLQLNSYENRVFDVRTEASGPSSQDRVIVKFYRPNRWTQAGIQEEHDFLADLAAGGLPVVAPIQLPDGGTLKLFNNMWMACFPKARGRLVQELTHPDLKKLGRTLARLHNIGQERNFRHRPSLTPKEFIDPALKAIEMFCPSDLFDRYLNTAEAIEDFLEDRLDPKKFIRIHGDCHRGNLLEFDQAGQNREFFLVDLDDCVSGPPAQDFWMLFSGDESEADPDLEALLSGYLELRHLDESDLEILPGLRGLRIIHYAGWIGRRWEDPSFPKLFPQYTGFDYWNDEVQTLQKLADDCFS
jgi:Ser/Thr protein kinase RdoA (MazF antagonist)